MATILSASDEPPAHISEFLRSTVLHGLLCFQRNVVFASNISFGFTAKKFNSGFITPCATWWHFPPLNSDSLAHRGSSCDRSFSLVHPGATGYRAVLFLTLDCLQFNRVELSRVKVSTMQWKRSSGICLHTCCSSRHYCGASGTILFLHHVWIMALTPE